MAIQLSAVIITHNEERNIARCLESLWGIADEIIVVDSFSTDKTQQICLEYKVRFYQRAFDGYSAQKNYGNSFASYPYILSLDADEVLTECLKKDLFKVKEDGNKDGYRLRRMANYCGTWIRHGAWYPDIQLRVFNKNKGTWSDSLVHEAVIMAEGSQVGMLKGNLLHYSYYTIDEHISRSNRYSTLAARELYQDGASFTLLKMLLKPCFRFVRDYIFRLGFLDGFAGFVIARITAHAVMLKYAKLRLFKKGIIPLT
ncbi:MAG: glycosyltransferase family 2 protein [Bacteroidales bacterium]|nr:glycosyltransferase family 2 protein [Lentimicrobiaceae bacterium]MDD5693835.1 glycosyltransferase family 2 protein [Bacteroidales bacterium]